VLSCSRALVLSFSRSLVLQVKFISLFLSLSLSGDTTLPHCILPSNKKKMRLSREVLLRYGRRDPAATDEVNTCCQQRVESYPIVSLHVRLGLFAWLRSELIAAAFDHAARTRGTRTAALVRVSTAVMRIDVCDKHEGDCCMARHVRALHAILRQNGLRCLWTYVEARIDAAHPRVQPHETFQDLRVRNVALKRICESLTLIPFSEGGNDACLLDQVLTMAANGFPVMRCRAAFFFHDVVRAIIYMKRWAKCAHREASLVKRRRLE